MSHNNPPQPLGEPEPISPSHGAKILKRASAVAIGATGGFLIFATLMTPARVRGATRSATLQWEARQAEIQQVVEAEQKARAEADATMAENDSSPDPK